jgi:hypothetical protein
MKLSSKTPALSIPQLRAYAIVPPGVMGPSEQGLMFRVTAADLERGDVEIAHGAASKNATISLSQCVALMRGGELTDSHGTELFEGDIVDIGSARAVLVYGRWHNRRNGPAAQEGLGWHLRYFVQRTDHGFEHIEAVANALSPTVESRYSGHVFQDAERDVALPAFREATGRPLDLAVKA